MKKGYRILFQEYYITQFGFRTYGTEEHIFKTESQAWQYIKKNYAIMIKEIFKGFEQWTPPEYSFHFLVAPVISIYKKDEEN